MVTTTGICKCEVQMQIAPSFLTSERHRVARSVRTAPHRLRRGDETRRESSKVAHRRVARRRRRTGGRSWGPRRALLWDSPAARPVALSSPCTAPESTRHAHRDSITSAGAVYSAACVARSEHVCACVRVSLCMWPAVQYCTFTHHIRT